MPSKLQILRDPAMIPPALGAFVVGIIVGLLLGNILAGVAIGVVLVIGAVSRRYTAARMSARHTPEDEQHRP